MKFIPVLVVAAAAWALTGCATSSGGTNSGDVAAVTAASEQLRLALIEPTRERLSALVADELSYGHSGGKVDTKAIFIADLVEGRSDFVTVAITEQTVAVVGPNAIVRHTLTADTNDSGKPGKVALKVLGVWQKQGAQWKLLARQAVRLAT